MQEVRLRRFCKTATRRESQHDSRRQTHAEELGIATRHPDDWFRIVAIAVAITLLGLYLFAHQVASVQLQN